MSTANPTASHFGHAHDLPRVDAAKVPRVIDRMRAIVGPDGVLTSPADLAVYECDGFTIEKNKPDVVVFPTTTEQVVAIVKACNELGRAVPGPRGRHQPGRRLPAGRRRRHDRADADEAASSRSNVRDRYAVVEPGVVNLWLTNHLKPHGYHFAPDPSSQGACTIGGNVATNSGGPHTLKYGVTVNHVLGVEMVLPDGRVVVTGGPCEDTPGLRPDRRRSSAREGTFGVVTKVVGAASPATRRRTARCSASSRRWTTRPTRSATSSAPGIVPGGAGDARQH